MAAVPGSPADLFLHLSWAAQHWNEASPSCPSLPKVGSPYLCNLMTISGVPEIPASFYQVFPYPEIPCIRITFYWLIVLSLLSTETGVTTSLKLSVLNIASLFCSWFVVLKRNKRRHDFIWFCVLMNFIPFPLHSKFSCAIGSILFLHLLCNLPDEANQGE